MKIFVKLIALTIILAFFTGCYDREIIDSKDFNHPLPKVENLTYTIQGNAVTLAWQIPDNISTDFRRPLEARVQVIENDIYSKEVNILNEVNKATIEIDSSKDYRFIVKLIGFLTPEVKVNGFTDRVFSEGVIIQID